MLELGAEFNIDYNGETAKVSEHTLGSDRVFRIVFSNRTPALVVTMTKGPDISFWTSIPEGRQREAENIGKLIAEHFKKAK